MNKARPRFLSLYDRIMIPLDILINGEQAMNPCRKLLEYKEGENYAIYLSNTWQKLVKGNAGGSMMRLIGESLKPSPECEYAIIFARELYRAPKYVRDFVIEHEKGHIKLFNQLPKGEEITPLRKRARANKKSRKWYINRGEVSPDELYADACDVEVLGKQNAINALTYLAEISKYNKKMIIPELKNRIKYITEGKNE